MDEKAQEEKRMGSAGQSHPTHEPWGSKPSPIPRRRRLAGRVIVPIITLLLGIVLGFMTLLLYVLYVLYVLSNVPPEPPVSVSPPPSSGDIVVQISPTYMVNILKPMLQKELSSYPLPSNIQVPVPGNIPVPPNTRLSSTFNNMKVQLFDSGSTGIVQIKTTADCEVTISTVLGFIGPVTIGPLPVTVTLVTQLLVQNGQLKANVLSNDIKLNGHSYTFLPAGLKSTIEGQIDQQLQIKTNDLPPGFDYRVTGVHSKPEGVYVTLSATPK
jgi:hypothetical protein